MTVRLERHYPGFGKLKSVFVRTCVPPESEMIIQIPDKYGFWVLSFRININGSIISRQYYRVVLYNVCVVVDAMEFMRGNV